MQASIVIGSMISQLTSLRFRRVKCDESYPACQRCLKLGRICDGYGVWGGGGALDHDSRALSTAATSSAVISPATILYRGPTTTPGLCVSSEQQVYLEWLLHGTAIKPPRIFNSRNWDHAILQATAHEPMLLQALLALSAAHRRHSMDPANCAREGLVPDALEVFLLKHYGNAIRGLQAYLEGGEKVLRSNWFVATTTCTLFVLLELMRGHFEAARIHIVKGVYMVKQFVNQSVESESSSKTVQFFLRLQHQIALYQRQLRSQQTMLDLPSAPVSEFRFSSPTEAQYLLDELVEHIAYLAGQKKLFPGSAKASRAVFDEACRFSLVALESWSLNCEATLAEGRMKMRPDDAAAYEALLRQCQMASSAARTSVGPGLGVDLQKGKAFGVELVVDKKSELLVPRIKGS